MTSRNREREEKFNRDERIVFDQYFKPALLSAQTFEDACGIVDDAVAPDLPGRKFYSNLGFFLQAFNVPHGASGAERGLYRGLIERLDAAGRLKKGEAERITGALTGATAA